MDERLLKFIKLVPAARWRKPPAIWSEPLRAALSDGLVTVGWGGILKLTEAGSAVLTLDRVGTVDGESAQQKSEG